MSHVDDCRMINLEKIEMPEGNLSPLYGGTTVPFPIKRAFYLYDVPGGTERGGHAHRVLQQFIVAASGAFSVCLDDGENRRTMSLDRSYHGLYVPSMVWAQVMGFCTGAICLVFASMPYEESDYIRNYEEFLSLAGKSDSGVKAG